MGEWAAKTEGLCRRIEQKTTAEVAVLTVPSTSPLPVEEYARLVFDRWKVGMKGKDNGVLFVVAVADRRLFIATGYGVEAVLPDGRVGEIRDAVMVPLFRRGAYGEGIYRGVAAVGSVLAGEAPAPGTASRRTKIPWAAALLVPLALLIVLRTAAARSRRALHSRGAGWYVGGLGGGFGGGFGSGGFGGFGGGSYGGGGAGGSW